MGTYVVTGAASGIGAATSAQLQAAGHAVIGADRSNADINADLGSPEGRAALVTQVTQRSPNGVDGVVAAAGTSGPDAETVLRVNYFGAVATMEGLLPLVTKTGGAVVAISSNSSTTLPSIPASVVEACLAGDEELAVSESSQFPDQAYAASKLALARWVRRNATTQQWIGSGVALNAIAPGLINTPMAAHMVDDVLGLGDVYPVPVNRAGTPDEVASLLCWMLSDQASFLCGSVLFIDGGTDAALNPDAWPTAP